MQTFQIDLIEPKAKQLLQDLAKLNLIRLREVAEPKKRFAELLNRIRSTEGEMPTLEEITAEVEAVRASRHEKGQ